MQKKKRKKSILFSMEKKTYQERKMMSYFNSLIINNLIFTYTKLSQPVLLFTIFSYWKAKLNLDVLLPCPIIGDIFTYRFHNNNYYGTEIVFCLIVIKHVNYGIIYKQDVFPTFTHIRLEVFFSSVKMGIFFLGLLFSNECFLKHWFNSTLFN